MTDEPFHDDSPRLPLLLLVAGSVLTLGIGTFMAVRHQSVLWLILAAAWVLANVSFIVLARWRLGRSRAGAPTGRTLVPPAGSEPGPSAALRWVGGANIPGFLGRMNATYPLAVLELTDSSLNLYVRPRLIARLFGIGCVVATNSDGLEAFPVTGRFWAPQGVGLARCGDATAYFWTTRREDVLQALVSASFRVTWDERRFSY